MRSSVPVVAYQFNPLENVNVFSNDASLLKPAEALDPGGSGEAFAPSELNMSIITGICITRSFRPCKSSAFATGRRLLVSWRKPSS